jgi:3-hydroxybutyryl-CoA dehydrogenase
MKISLVSVVGSGYMGAQIALRSAAKGFNVKLYDVKEDALEKAKELQEKELSSNDEKKVITPSDKKRILGRITYTADLKEAVCDADLVVETIPEVLELKRAIFEKIDKASPLRTVIATNSSSIRVSLIEDACKRPDKVLNLHFYPPIWQRPMVELMRGSKTSDETIDLVKDYVKGIEMTPLMVQKESTGFLFNRVWRAIKKESLHLVDDGVASFMDVDRAWMIVFQSDVGPFGLMDMVGLDVVRDIEMVYYGESGDESDYPPELLLDKIEKGELGIKTGKGFYTYPNPAYRDPTWLKG